MLKFIGFLIVSVVLLGFVLASCEQTKEKTMAKCELRAMETFKVGKWEADSRRFFETCMKAEGYVWVGDDTWRPLSGPRYDACVKRYDDLGITLSLCWTTKSEIAFRQFLALFKSS